MPTAVSWNDDDPRDAATLQGNARRLAAQLLADAPRRGLPDATLVLAWHVELYGGCHVPSPHYVGAFRGDRTRPDLTDYGVGVGPILADGHRAKEGLPPQDVAGAVAALMTSLEQVVRALDAFLPVGSRPGTVEELTALVSVAAQLHGEWVRIHPFANGNGRTARTWVTWLMLRYNMPTFLSLKPRPSDVAYVNAAQASMGRPPDYTADHGPTEHVFALLMALSLLP